VWQRQLVPVPAAQIVPSRIRAPGGWQRWTAAQNTAKPSAKALEGNAAMRKWCCNTKLADQITRDPRLPDTSRQQLDSRVWLTDSQI
jgi:hypothetical protein